MIVVKVELWPGGYEKLKKEIGRMTITNAGTNDSHPARGDYEVSIMRRGTATHVQRTGSVKNHARLSSSIWKLVKKALASTDF